MKALTKKADLIGALASSLCLVHCLATPFIFVAHSVSSACCADAPTWWKWIDYIFLVVSFGAIVHSARHSSKKWIKHALWISWSLLAVVIINERLGGVSIPYGLNYLPALGLVGFHLYNKKYCQCVKEKCCVELEGTNG